MKRWTLLSTLSFSPLLLSGCGGAAADCPPAAAPEAPPQTAQAPVQEPAQPAEPPPPVYVPHRNAAVLGTLYSNTAAEYHATTRTAYAAAQVQLDKALRTWNWTAALEQKDQKLTGLKPAVVVDVDETVLDNSPYQARVVQTGETFPKGWAEWCQEAKAKPVAGALEFAKYAESKGVVIFYITNRKAPLEEATRKNLKEVGFPIEDDPKKLDVVLMREEKEGWSSDKTSRRELVAKTHRILLMFGDSLGDFVAGKDADTPIATRNELIGKYSESWGSKWFMLPNPMYGSWDSATFGFDYAQSEDKKGAARVKAMDAAR